MGELPMPETIWARPSVRHGVVSLLECEPCPAECPVTASVACRSDSKPLPKLWGKIFP